MGKNSKQAVLIMVGQWCLPESSLIRKRERLSSEMVSGNWLVKLQVFFKSWKLWFQSSTSEDFASIEGKLVAFVTFIAPQNCGNDEGKLHPFHIVAAEMTARAQVLRGNITHLWKIPSSWEAAKYKITHNLEIFLVPCECLSQRSC